MCRSSQMQMQVSAIGCHNNSCNEFSKLCKQVEEVMTVVHGKHN